MYLFLLLYINHFNMALISWFIFFSILVLSTATDTLQPTQQIKDGDSLVSAGSYFKLGFFSPENSKNRYIGIWFNTISNFTPVWVANREVPLTNLYGVLMVTNHGITLLDGNNTIIWSSSDSTGSTENLVAQLLDSGNLVLKERREGGSPQKLLWQSFDFPCDTFLPGMKLGKNYVTGEERHLSSWMTASNPAKGNYTLELDDGVPQLVSRRNSNLQYYSYGLWNGLCLSGTPYIRSNCVYNFVLVSNHEEAYYFFELKETSIKIRLVMSYNGDCRWFIWNKRNKEWGIYMKQPIDICDKYAACGAYGRCKIDNSPQCECLEKFEPMNINEWNHTDWTHGCVRRKPLDCHKDGFMKYTDINLPDTRNSRYDRSLDLEGCKMVCMRNCSCVAYTRLDTNTRSGCLLWFGDLINIREFPQNGQEIYIRLTSSEFESSSKMKRIKYIVIFLLVVGMLISGLSVTLNVFKKKKQLREEMLEHIEQSGAESDTKIESPQEEDLELPIFDYSTITTATDNFSINNKLGEGGFGPVYKGILPEGQEIAVKKLSKSSRQGIDEFKNEVLCISKLQHRNLVRLLGCCIHVEKMLIYEYMSNKSLDIFIFTNQERSVLLDWPKLFNIINGISRGLLYLHQDSRLRIIHRDLKASNILLDHEMNPKISDFGMARSLRGNETAANTTRVAGTHGYMSPEYAVDGIFSVKSDVFSFGVLLLEIVSGKKNRGFYHEEHNLNLLGHAWKLHNEGKSLELMNECLRNSCNLFQVSRSIHVGLLCVQQFPEDRPNMSTVVLMLSSDGELPQPKQPGFFIERNTFETNSSLYFSASVNEVTNTMVMSATCPSRSDEARTFPNKKRKFFWQYVKRKKTLE